MRTALLAFWLLFGAHFAGPYDVRAQGPSAAYDFAPRTAFTDEETAAIKARLLAMDYVIGERDHPMVMSYLRGYLLRNREKSETILGRIPTYFPMFEEELARAGLPDDIKYLAVVESALHPKALSPVGAGGLWQFMPGTGKLYGLRVDRTVDERGDALLATRAAIAFLKAEYARFGDWALVLAAYNGGPGRVRRAMRRSGRRDFWSLRRYLPRETRNYVPGFIAAAYLHRYGHLHGLRPIHPALDEQLMVSVACPRGVSLREVAQATELPLAMIRYHNPHCLKDYLPAPSKAHVRVPARSRAALVDYLAARDSDGDAAYVASVRARPLNTTGFTTADAEHYLPYEVELPARTPLSKVAAEQGVSEHHLRLWNPRLSPYSASPQSLRLFSYEGEVAPLAALRPRAEFTSLPTKLPEALPVNTVFPKTLDGRVPNHKVTIQRYESLLDIWHRYSASMTWQEFVSWNGIGPDTELQPGDKVLVRS